jgi:hypothetical protein
MSQCMLAQSWTIALRHVATASATVVVRPQAIRVGGALMLLMMLATMMMTTMMMMT